VQLREANRDAARAHRVVQLQLGRIRHRRHVERHLHLMSDDTGHSMRRLDELAEALDLARSREVSDGAFRDRATRVVTDVFESDTPQDDS
jgi:hypothetical protein